MISFIKYHYKKNKEVIDNFLGWFFIIFILIISFVLLVSISYIRYGILGAIFLPIMIFLMMFFVFLVNGDYL